MTDPVNGGGSAEPEAAGPKAEAAGTESAESDTPKSDAGRPSQAAKDFVEPPREQIPGISAAHVAALEAGGFEEFWVGAGMGHVILRTVGRKSGTEHKVALPFWIDLDGDGSRVVVASFAGAPTHPAWYFNVTDRAANGEVLVRVREGSYWARPDSLEGEEYDRVWAALTLDRPFYNGYRERTSRRIPLIRLVELRPA